MNIGILYFAGKGYGYGHHYRCIELAKELEINGHTVYMFTNLQFRRKLYYQLRPNEQYDFYHIVHQCSIDWLIVDTPDLPNEYMYTYRNEFKYKILYLNADQDLPLPDISVIQGCLPGKYSGSDYVILRHSMLDSVVKNENNSWFVFGGAEDKLGLLPEFDKAMPGENALLMGTTLFDLPKNINSSHIGIIAQDDNAFLNFMGNSSKACISFGTIAWELAYLGVPVYAFSPTKDHLRWAMAMSDEGYIHAYPDIGLPMPNKIRDFLHEEFIVRKDGIDGKGAERIVKLLEKNNAK